MRTLHCVVYGRVQGLGFRYSAQNKAKSLGLSGWVKNLPDGSVETLACGVGVEVGHYLEWLRNGHGFARVDSIRIIEDSESPNAGLQNKGFQILY